MKHVLFIVHGFPPLGGAGVQRVAKFVKYLPEFGWRPLVLTAKLNVRDLAVWDDSLRHELPADLVVRRTTCPEPFMLYKRLGGGARLGSAAFSETGGGSRSLSGRLAQFLQRSLVPDTKVFWLGHALSGARSLFAQYPIDAMVSSSPWETVHLVAGRLRKTQRVPWVADFRDPWTRAPWNPGFFTPLGRLNKAMEASTVRRADALVVTSHTTAEAFLKDYPPPTVAQKLQVIYNGYDESDFRDLVPRRFDRFTVVYAGRVVMPGRGPEPLLAGLSRLVARRPEVKGRMQLLFIGAPSPAARALVRRFGLEDLTRFTGYLAHRECLEHEAGADLLYLNTIPMCIPGKFTEYLRTGRPILAIMDPECETARLTRELSAGTVVSPQDEEGVAGAVERRLDHPTGRHEVGREVESFSRRSLTGELAGVLDRLSRKGR